MIVLNDDYLTGHVCFLLFKKKKRDLTRILAGIFLSDRRTDFSIEVISHMNPSEILHDVSLGINCTLRGVQHVIKVTPHLIWKKYNTPINPKTNTEDLLSPLTNYLPR